MNGRAIGSMILQYAKRDISNFIFRIVKLFHTRTTPKECEDFMTKNDITECHVYLCGTDTDSAQFQIVCVAQKSSKMTSDKYALKIKHLICKDLKELYFFPTELFEETF